MMEKQEEEYYHVEPVQRFKEEPLDFEQPQSHTQKKVQNSVGSQIIKEEKPENLPKTQNQSSESPSISLNQNLFSQAASQRKNLNLNNLKIYMGKRVSSYQQRSRIFEMLRYKLYDKQKLSKKIIETIIKYFVEYENLLKFLQKSISTKLQLKKKYKNFNMLAAIKDSIEELVDLNDKEIEHLQKFIDWIQKILIQALKAAQTYYKERVKKFTKDLQKFDHAYYDAFDKEQKYYEKLADGADLLEKQLGLMEKLKITDQALIGRGVEIYQAWQAFLEEEKTLKKLLRENILQFNEQYINFHKKVEAAKNLSKFWSALNYTPSATTIFQSLLTEAEIQFVCYEDLYKKQDKKPTLSDNNKPNEQTAKEKQKLIRSQITKLQKNIENFLRLSLQEKRIGNPYPHLDILVVKKFKTKVQRGSRDWKDIKLIFTVDKNLLLFDEINGKCLLRLTEQSIRLKRVSQNIIELVGIEVGFLINSTRKQMIHFQTLDAVQEYIYYVENIPKVK